MKAVVYTRYGAPDVLQNKEIARPVPKDNEALIEVYAATVNRTDTAIIQAKPFSMRNFTGFVRPKNRCLAPNSRGKSKKQGRV